MRKKMIWGGNLSYAEDIHYKENIVFIFMNVLKKKKEKLGNLIKSTDFC